ncbi:MAG: fasciclin domain-containing protein [Gemmatimonadaceae bacterium]|nr:fasciclin domain-containing protein [Gemmatimonadaceae bacterium]
MRTQMLVSLGLLLACQPADQQPADQPGAAPAVLAGQSGVKDDASEKDVVKIAVGSPDHTTLVKAVQAAGLVDALSNAGPFTVFAPTNAAFDRLPAGTLDELLKPANADKLRGILQHHVTVSAFQIDQLTDGLELGMADGGRVTITHKGSDVYVGEAKIVGSVRGSNGMVHVIDGVVLPAK